MLWFGRRREKKKEGALLHLKLRLNRWRHLLRAEEFFLTQLTDMEQKLSGDYILDRQYILSGVGRLFQQAYQVAYDVGVLGGQEDIQIYTQLDELREKISDYLNAWPLLRDGPAVIPLSKRVDGRAEQVGEMGVNLFEVLRKGSSPLVPGFIITVQGFLRLLDFNLLGHFLRPVQGSKRTEWRDRYETLSERIGKASIPEDLKKAIGEAVHSMKSIQGKSPSLILWPSPIQSRALRVFPFPTFSWPGDSLDQLWETLLSLWSRLYHHPELDRTLFSERYPLVCAVICQAHLPGRKGYVVGTVDLGDGEEREFRFYPAAPSISGNASMGNSHAWHVSSDSAPGDPRSQGRGKKLALLSSRIEAHLKRAQETLWEEAGEENFFLRQLRPQDIPVNFRIRATERRLPSRNPLPKYFIHQGQIVCHGIASGPVIHLHPGQDASNFPPGGILVASDWRPEWRTLGPKISAILIGKSSSSSLALWARSYRIPAIAQLPGVMEKIPPGSTITLDAEEGVIYGEEVQSLLAAQLLDGPRFEDEPEYLLLKGVLRWVDPSFLPEGESLQERETLLDLIQGARRRALDVFFDAATWRPWVTHHWAVPLSGVDAFPIYTIDLEESWADSPKTSGPRATLDGNEIQSAPWLALWQGLAFPGRIDTIPLSQGEKEPAWMVYGGDSLLFCKPSEKGERFLDAAVTAMPEWNYFFFYSSENRREEGHDAPNQCFPARERAKGAKYEERLFERPTAEIKEHLKFIGQKLSQESPESPQEKKL